MMSSGTGSAGKGVAAYTRGLDALVQAREKAVLDRNFASAASAQAEQRPRIVYFFDANICISYTVPEQSVFLEASGVSGLFSENRHTAVERMTVRYMLDGKLPGQDGLPVFMTPQHWNELIDHASRRLRAGGQAAQSAHSRIPTGVLNQLAVAKTPGELLEVARKNQVATQLEALGKAIALGRRIEILFGKADDDAKVLGVESAPNEVIRKAWSDAGNRTSWRVESAWRRAISAAKREDEERRLARLPARNSEMQRERARRATQRDAASLALIETLYQMDPYAGGEGAQRRYVFVTSDTHIINAVKTEMPRLVGNGVPDFVRSPATFLPFADYDHFHEVMTSKVSDASLETARRFREVLTKFRALQGTSGAPKVKIGNLNALREDWDLAADDVSIIGNENFIDDFHSEGSARFVRETYEYLTYENVGEAIERELQTKMNRVTERHEHVRVMADLSQLATRFGPPPGQGTAPRAPLHFLTVDVLEGARDAGLTRESDTVAFLAAVRDDAANGGTLASELAEFLKTKLKAKPSPKTMLLTAAVFVYAGLWTTALNCAQRASELQRERVTSGAAYTRPVVLESNYIRALCLRMTLRGPREYEDAYKFLSDTSEARGDTHMNSPIEKIAAIRDRIERTTLTLTAALLQLIGSGGDLARLGVEEDEFFRSKDLPDRYNDSIDRLSNTAAILEDNFVVANADVAQMRRVVSLIVRARSNILAAEVNRYFLPTLQAGLAVDSDAAVDDAHKALIKARERYEDHLHPTRQSQDIYIKLACFIAGHDFKRPDYLDLMAALKLNLDASYAASPDHDEFAFLRTAVRNQAETRGLVQDS